MSSYIIYSAEDDEGVLHIGCQVCGMMRAITRSANMYPYADLYQLQLIDDADANIARHYIEAYRIKYGFAPSGRYRVLPSISEHRAKIDIDNPPDTCRSRKRKVNSSQSAAGTNGWWDFSTNRVIHNNPLPQ